MNVTAIFESFTHMKSKKLIIVFTFVVGAFLLSACAGVIGASSWPGITATEDTIYVAYAAGVRAINAGNGTQLWRYPAEPGNRTFFAAPVISGDQLIVGDYTNVLSSINRQGGAERWTFTGATGRFIASPLVTDELILAPSADHFLYALDKNGQEQWRFRANHGLWSAPALVDEVVFLSSMDHHLYALNVNNGQEIWRVNAGGSIVHTPKISDDGLVLVGTLGSEVLAVDFDGNIRWRTPTDNAVWTRPTQHNGVVFFGDLDGVVYAVNVTDGSIAWRKNLAAGAIVGSAVVIEDLIVFVTETGRVEAFTPGGESRWNRSFNGKLYSNPVVAGNRIIIGIIQGDYMIAALDSNGSELWTFTPEE
jgi:outer membrane protein assembly factor BamB